jgi:hypothetical protein
MAARMMTSIRMGIGPGKDLFVAMWFIYFSSCSMVLFAAANRMALFFSINLCS